ncbi:MAG: glutamate racemase [Bacilli bacterium]|nr:glutamate racemase [Bacilli bacterium]
MSKIGVFDSGLGGLSVLKELRKILPDEDYIYYADSINVPYGEKTDEELLELTSKIVDYMIKEDCKLIVIACNTATTSCMLKLREKYPDIVFVGTVPAIKVAYDYNYKDTIILSTPYTTKSKRVQELIHDYKRDDQNLYLVSGENLAGLIEEDSKEEIDKVLERILGEYRGKVDSIVLGCTHYSLIKEEISRVLPNIAILDGCVGISMEVKRQLENNNLIGTGTGDLTIINTKSNSLVKRSYEILNDK